MKSIKYKKQNVTPIHSHINYDNEENISDSDSISSSDDGKNKHVPIRNEKNFILRKKQRTGLSFSFSEDTPTVQTNPFSADKACHTLNILTSAAFQTINLTENGKKSKEGVKPNTVSKLNNSKDKDIFFKQPITDKKNNDLNKRVEEPHEVIIRKYLNHCATFIQKHFKRYRMVKKHKDKIKVAMRRKELRRATLKGWKTRKILKSFKVQARKHNVQTLIDLLKTMKNKKETMNLVAIKKERHKAVEELIRIIKILYITGDWTKNLPSTHTRTHIHTKVKSLVNKQAINIKKEQTNTTLVKEIEESTITDKNNKPKKKQKYLKRNKKVYDPIKSIKKEKEKKEMYYIRLMVVRNLKNVRDH